MVSHTALHSGGRLVGKGRHVHAIRPVLPEIGEKDGTCRPTERGSGWARRFQLIAVDGPCRIKYPAFCAGVFHVWSRRLTSDRRRASCMIRPRFPVIAEANRDWEIGPPVGRSLACALRVAADIPQSGSGAAIRRARMVEGQDFIESVTCPMHRIATARTHGRGGRATQHAINVVSRHGFERRVGCRSVSTSLSHAHARPKRSLSCATGRVGCRTGHLPDPMTALQ